MRGIYKIELDGKCLYVGQSKDIKRRWTEHRRHLKQNKHENVYLQRIYNKYKNFQYLVVEENDFGNLNKLELKYIENLHPLCNMQIPDKNGSFTVTEESRKKMSQATLSRVNDEYRKKISEGVKRAHKDPEIRRRFLEGQANKKNKTAWNKGIKMSEEQRFKSMKKVVCVELDQIFDGAVEAGKILGINHKHICDVCKGRRKSCGGYTWKYY